MTQALKIASDLNMFLFDRLRQVLRDEGKRHDLVDAAFGAGDADEDMVSIVKRIGPLGDFLATEDGQNLLAGYKRAANILAIEEKKDDRSYSANTMTIRADKVIEPSGPGVFMPGDPPEVGVLVSALANAEHEADAALEKEDFAEAMRALSKLRGPVDAFFDKVTVNADDRAVRENRLKILSQIRDALGRVADFSKIEG